MEGGPPVEDSELLESQTLESQTGVGRAARRQATGGQSPGGQAPDRQWFAGPTPSTGGRDGEDNRPALRAALRDSGARVGAEPLASDPPAAPASRPAQMPPAAQLPVRPANQARMAARASRAEIDASLSTDAGADLEHTAEEPVPVELQEWGPDRARPIMESLLAGNRATTVGHGDDRSAAFVSPNSERNSDTVPDTRALLRDHVVPELEALGLLVHGERVDLSEASAEAGSTVPRPGRVAVAHGAVRTSDPTAVDAHTTEVHVHIDRLQVLRAAPAPAPPPQPGMTSVGGPPQPSRLDHYLEHRAAGN
ncbi:hypothetical protein [Tessaracoccus sp.]